jgi:hypothetical protein
MLRATKVGLEAGAKKSLDTTLLGAPEVTSWNTTLLAGRLWGVGSRKKKPRPRSPKPGMGAESLEGNCTSVNCAPCTMALRGMASGMGKESTAR